MTCGGGESVPLTGRLWGEPVAAMGRGCRPRGLRSGSMSVETPGALSYEGYCSAVDAEIARFAEIAVHADPAMPVPTCPGWTVTKLLKHLGIAHRWVEHIVGGRLLVPIPQRDVPVALPSDERAYPGWLAEGGKSMVATLRAAGPDAAVWSWGAGQSSGFWARRMLHETTVHRADAEIALGREPRVDAAIATDGVGEILDNLLAAPWAAGGLTGIGDGGETLHFHATDVEAAGEGEWMVTLLPGGGYTWEHGHGKGDVAVRGTASDLLLLVYGRLDPLAGRFEVFGDHDLLARWRRHTAI